MTNLAIPAMGARRASLDALLSFAWHTSEFTATEAMAAVGLTRSTTIDAADELVVRGILTELPNARSGDDYRTGRPARRFTLRSDAAVVVGMDAGRAHLNTTVTDLRGAVLAQEHVVLDVAHDTADERQTAAASAVDDALRAAARSRADVLALCVGVPAPVSAAGVSPPHWDNFWRRMNPNFGELFGSWCDIVRVENDASLAAVAEGSVGVAAGCDNYVALLAGERLGAGVVIDGRLLRGTHGGVGEMVAFDHVADVDGAWGIGYRAAEWAREAIASGEIGPRHPLALLPAHEIDGRAVLHLAAAGDPDAELIVNRLGGMLARIAGVFGSLFDPQRVVVSGAIAEGIDGVLAAANARIDASQDLPAPQLVASRLGADVVSIGAVAAGLEAARAGALDHARFQAAG